MLRLFCPDFIQLDSDSDGCFDADEAGFTATLGVLDGTAFNNEGLVSGGDGYDFAAAPSVNPSRS